MKLHSLCTTAVTAAASCLLMLLGCSDAVHDVGALSDDALAETIDLSECQNLDCAARPESQALERAAAVTCDPGLPRTAGFGAPADRRPVQTGDPRIGSGSLFFGEEYLDRILGDDLPTLCVTSGCQQLNPRLALTPNDAAWFTGVLAPPGGQAVGVLLTYFPGTTGELTAFRRFFRYRQDEELAGSLPYIDTRVAASPSGDAAVLIISEEALLPTGDRLRFRLMRFDEQGTSLHAPIDFTHAQTVVAMDFDTEDNLYLVFRVSSQSLSTSTAVAKLDPAFALSWLHNKATPNDSAAQVSSVVSGAVDSPDGSVTLEFELMRPSETRRGLMRLTPSGELLWEQTRELDSDGGNALGMVVDHRAQLVTASYFSVRVDPNISPVLPGSSVPWLRVEKFDADATPLWHLEIPVLSNGRTQPFLPVTSTSPVTDAAGYIYVASGVGINVDGEESETYRPAVVRITPDGEECSLVAFVSPESALNSNVPQPAIDQLALSPGGLLYVLGQGGLGVYSINDLAFTLGRLAPESP